MPVYKPLGTKVQLVVCSLADTTTANPQRQKQRATHDTKQAEVVLLKAPPLSESHIPCLGDTTRLHFLGNVPFYLIQAGTDLFKAKEPSLADRARALIKQRKEDLEPTREEVARISGWTSRDPSVASESRAAEEKERRRSKSSARGGRRRSSAIANKTSTPQALGLIITLSKNTFLNNWESVRHVREGKGPRLHVKYDVYFNGELTVSDCQHSRYFTGKEDEGAYPSLENGNIRIISGKKVGILVERPWVIVPPEQKAGGSLRQVKRSKAGIAGASERWQAVGKALLQRADELGYNTKEERSPLGQYLANLAAMEMPDGMAEMQKPGGHKFGVIDVVITGGQGTKGQPSSWYLARPESLVDPEFKRMPEGWKPKCAQQPQTSQEPPISQLPVLTSQLHLLDHSRSEQNGETSTIAATREKRNIATPSSYRDAAPRRSRTSTPEVGSTAPPQRTSILPAFPAIPEIDFNDAIAVTPTKAEVTRMNRGTETSSPTADALKRAGQGPGSSLSMPPPPTPIPRSARTNKRRYSDTISVGESSPSKNAPTTTRPGAAPGSKSVSSYMGMTKRGIFNKGAVTLSPSKERDPAQSQQAKDPLTMTRLVITGREAPIVDKNLAAPYTLNSKSRTFHAGRDFSSQFQPLDESVVFGLKNHETQAKPAVPLISSDPPTILQPQTEQQSIPTRTPPTKADQAQPTSAPALVFAALPMPTPKSRQATPALKPKAKHEDLLDEARATWKTPELSEDCVISFAEEGDWITAEGKGSVLRHVKSHRAGMFVEREVVFAVRYIIAGDAGLTM